MNKNDKSRMRNGIVFCTILAVLIGVIIAVTSLKNSHPASREGVEIPAPFKAVPDAAPIQKPGPIHDEARVTTKPSRAVQPSSPALPAPPSARQLLAEMAELSGANGPITPEKAEKFKQNLAELIRQGASSVPAIRELLAKNQDSYYADISGGDQLGYSSLRASLFDALKQIGGPEAQATMLETLHTSALPAELLELAKNLEQAAPGQYRDQILNAAREAATMASANQLGSNVEVAAQLI